MDNLVQNKLNNLQRDYDQLYDLCESLFQSVDDRDAESVSGVCALLVEQFGFDIDDLPGDVYEETLKRLNESARDSWADEQAEEVLYG